MCSSYVWRSLGLRELEDRKAWFRRNPEIPGESLRIIARGFERFDKSGKRFELLALDEQSTTVVTEQKGGPGCTLADLQTTRRVAFSSTLDRKSPCQLKFHLQRLDRLLS
jgi:hypothetical protein